VSAPQTLFRTRKRRLMTFVLGEECDRQASAKQSSERGFMERPPPLGAASRLISFYAPRACLRPEAML
jgi:hypothetical protein